MKRKFSNGIYHHFGFFSDKKAAVITAKSLRKRYGWQARVGQTTADEICKERVDPLLKWSVYYRKGRRK